MKLKRILAWIIDWNLCGVPALLYATLYMYVIGETNVVGMLLFILFVLSYSRREPNSYALRRCIFASFAAARLERLTSFFASLRQNPSKIHSPEGACSFE